MPTLPNMTLVTPVQGADSGTWDDKINACFELLDAHDHTSGKGVAVPVAGLDIDADLPMGGNGLTGVGRVDFNTVAALAAGANVLFVSSDDGELYWRTTGGTNVKLTDGASINTTLVGGIVGDYSSIGAEVAYSDADQIYTFKDEEAPTKKWARLGCGPVRIYQFDTTESVYVELAIDAATAVNYTITLPAAVPGAAALVQISAAGVVSFSNTTTGTITAGALKYTTATTTYIPPAAFQPSGSAHVYNGGGYWDWGATASDSIIVPIPVIDGETLTGFTLYVDKNSDAANQITAVLRRISTTGSSNNIATDSDVQNAPNEIELSAAFTHAVVADNFYEIHISCDDATPSAIDKIRGCKITRTRP